MSEPFTPDHFESWARGLLLDNGSEWILEPFQLAFLEDLFAGRRENWLLVPEGNGKTTLIAGLALYHLRFRDEASVPIAASSRDQAKIMYRQAKGFIRRSGLRQKDKDGVWFEAFDGYKRIDLRGPMDRNRRGEVLGTIEIHAADADTGDGVIPTLAILDELHRHKDLDLYETWRGKLEKRDAQLVVISTAGSPGSDFEEMRTAIRKSGKKTLTGRTFLRVEGPGIVMHEHALPEGGDVHDLELVAEANPYSAITKNVLKKKKATPTLSLAHWTRLTCNLAADIAGERFIPDDDWKKCAGGEEIELGSDVCLGADGSRVWDTTVIAWAEPGETINVDCRVFSVRPDAAHHITHRGGKIDFGDVESFLVDLFDKFHPLETGYDPRYLQRSMEIVDVRLPESAVIAIEPQTKAARDAYQALFTAVVDGKLRHRNDPVLNAHIANCAVDRDDRTREIRRLRKIDPRKPIDAVPALAFAVWRAQVGQKSTPWVAVA